MAQTDIKGQQWNTQGRREVSVGGEWNLRVTDGEQSILRQALRCGFLGNSQQGAGSLLGVHWGKELLSVLVGEEQLSWVYRRP